MYWIRLETCARAVALFEYAPHPERETGFLPDALCRCGGHRQGISVWHQTAFSPAQRFNASAIAWPAKELSCDLSPELEPHVQGIIRTVRVGLGGIAPAQTTGLPP
jgi:hypothetical protein